MAYGSPTIAKSTTMSFVPQAQIYRRRLAALESSNRGDSTGAKYLGAYLELAGWPGLDSVNDNDRLFVALTLKEE